MCSICSLHARLKPFLPQPLAVLVLKMLSKVVAFSSADHIESVKSSFSYNVFTVTEL